MQPAAEDPQTATSLDAHQAGAVRWIGGGAIAVVLGVLLATAVMALARDGGSRVPGAGVAVAVLVLLGAVGIVAGTGALLRTRRWRRALATQAWQVGRLRIAGPAVLSFEPAGSGELDDTSEPVHLRLLSTAVWRTRAVQRLDGADVLAAPVGDRQWVLTADGLDTVVGARAVRSTGR